ncbi:ATP-binding protein [Dictyobacter aurantiacus]|uniref:Bacterial transcriptional activator domain-containing protein n=1 Tax=Dictyobacter aurantiacus TaxID=1936993 RepID=A0A401ZRC0_9CHLR|nr:AAA family ATPase [Dictyobacter aurantiacus]GCE09419.1 hypothetical protein KDAU_67480 [Dictyobacter aurantiacus]
MSDLKIALLGTPIVEHCGQRVTFYDRKTLALLIYLATEPGVHSRQMLARLLWSESDAAHGRAALRIALLHLRQALEEKMAARHGAHLLITHDTLGLDLSSGIELDLHAFETAWTLLQQLPAPEMMPGEARRTVIAHLQQAIAFYRGGFLDNFALRDAIDFDHWVGMQRQIWFKRIEQILDWLSQLQNAEGQIEQAIETVERWRTYDALNETIYLRLMQLHFSLGNRVAALKTYETCQEVLHAELSARPSSSLQALSDLIRNTSPVPRGKNYTSTNEGTSSVRTLLEIPFVGRGANLSRLITFYEKAAGGQPHIVMLEGEAGAGKSRLASAFLDWARVQGARILEAKAYETYQRLAYQPLLDCFRPFIEQTRDLHHLLSDTWIAELSRLWPELCERYPDLPAPTIDEAFASTRLLEALARLGQASATQQPLLLFIDDLQWADEATLDALHYLSRRWSDRAVPVLLLFNRRIGTVRTQSRLGEWLTNLKSVISLTRLELGPLSPQDLLHIAHTLLTAQETLPTGSRAGDLSEQHDHTSTTTLSAEQFAAWLYAETQGQPFYVVALLEELLEHGGLVPRFLEGKGWIFEPQAALLQTGAFGGRLPANVREVLQSRLDQLSPATRDLLAAAAVLDHDFTFEHLCRIAQLSTHEGLIGLDEALNSLFLRESRRQSESSHTICYVFVHDKMRELVYREMGKERRHVFHGRALQLLKEIDAPAAEVAYHAVASGATDAVFRWSLAAGDEALHVFAIRDAIRHYEQAHQLINKQEMQVPAAELAHLFTQLGRAYEHRNDAQAAHATYQMMLTTARQSADPGMECSALNHLAVLISEDFSQMPRAMALLHDALVVAERSHDKRAIAQTQWSLARVNYYVLNLDASLSYARQAYALASELEQHDLIANSLNILAYITRALGQWEEAASYAEEARQRFATQGNRMMEADCLSRIADARINCGQPYEGIAAARSAYAISCEIEHPWGQANCGYQLVRNLVEIGYYEEALTIALQSTAIARTLTFNIILFVNLISLGLAYQALLLPEKALHAHMEAWELSETVPSSRYTGLSISLLCIDYALIGDWETASMYARQALVMRDPRAVVCPEAPRWPETVALLYTGASTQATEDLQTFYQLFGANKRCSISYARARAALAEAQGETEQALTCLQQASALAKDLGLPGERWQAEAALGRLHQSREEHEQAAQAFARAAAVVEELASKITNDELRSQFLASPQVRSLFSRDGTWRV